MLIRAGVGLAAAAYLRWYGRIRRASPAARGWRRGAGRSAAAGPLHVRIVGDRGPVVVLVHGLVGSGLEWGAGWDPLGERYRVLVPDLLGFGRSQRRDAPAGYGVAAQLDALDRALHAVAPDAEPVLVGHSMGGLLALSWAARRVRAGAPVRGVTAFSPPLYADAAEADRVLAESDRVNRLMTADSAFPRRLCGAICGGPWWGKAIYVLANPQLPPAVAADAVHHSWHSYRQCLDEVIRTPTWAADLGVCTPAGVPVLLAAGAADHMIVPGRHVDAAQRLAGVRSVTHPSAGHMLPLDDPALCLAELAALG